MKSEPLIIDVARYGPWALIAGASEGVGAEFARLLAEAGINLVLVARRPAPLEALAEMLRPTGVQVRTVSVDLTEATALGVISKQTDDLDIGLLILNAGSNTYRSEFVESDPIGVQTILDLNIISTLNLCRHYGKHLKDRGRGAIILVGSLAGYLGHANIGIYAAAKAFVRIFAEGLWLELEPFGVRVIELVLGLTRTPAMERAGLRFDLPGVRVSEPADVAREGLLHLADGPVWVAGGNDATVRHRSGSNRAELIRGNQQTSRTMLGAENASSPGE